MSASHLGLLGLSILVPHLHAAAPTPFRTAVAHVIQLRTGERITGELLAVDADEVRLRTPWAAKVVLRRNVVVAITQLPGWLTVVDDEFEAGTKTWAITGKPAVSGSAVLNAPSQMLTHGLAEPLIAGRVGVNFEDRDQPTGGRWMFEAEFSGEKGPHRLRVVVAGAGKSYVVEADGISGTGREEVRTPGSHRLELRFGPRSVAVLADDAVLWHNLERGPGGPLTKVRLACIEEKGAAVKGAVAWTAFAVAAAVNELQRPPGDLTQDEIWLANGDQIFGTIVRVDRRSVVLKGRFGEKSFLWSGVRGCYLRKMPVPIPAADGALVRLRLHAPFGGEPDVLDGVVIKSDDKALTLRHALVGEIAIERGRVNDMRKK